jgi:hypothetical protein
MYAYCIVLSILLTDKKKSCVRRVSSTQLVIWWPSRSSLFLPTFLEGRGTFPTRPKCIPDGNWDSEPESKTKPTFRFQTKHKTPFPEEILFGLQKTNSDYYYTPIDLFCQ